MATEIKEIHQEVIHQLNVPFVMIGQGSDGIILLLTMITKLDLRLEVMFKKWDMRMSFI